MAKIPQMQTSFNAGELYPRLYAQVDLDKYKNGLAIATNCFVAPHGPVIRRNGFKYIAEVKDSTKATRLLRFQFSADDAFIIEAGNLYFRFFAPTGQVESGGSPYEIVTPYLEADLFQITYVQFGNDIYLAHPDHAPRRLRRNSTTDWTLSTLEFEPPSTYQAGEEPATTITPAATTGTAVNFTAGSAVFELADKGRAITNLVGVGQAVITSVTSTTVVVCNILEAFPSTSAIASGDWDLDLSPVCDLHFSSVRAGSICTVSSFFLLGTFGDAQAISAVTQANPAVVTVPSGHGVIAGDLVKIEDITGMTELNGNTYRAASVTATTITLKSTDSSAFVTYGSGGTLKKSLDNLSVDCFKSTDVGKYIVEPAGGVIHITEFVDAKTVVGKVMKTIVDSEVSFWTMEVESWNSTRGYPGAIALKDERLVLGGTTAQPQNIWFSESGIFTGMGIGTATSDAISVSIQSPEVSKITWMQVARDLVVGTTGAEVTVSPASGSVISGSNIQQYPRSTKGSDSQKALTINSEVVFFQKSERKILSMIYDFNIDGYTSDDLTFLSYHLTEGAIKEMVFAQEPDSIMYAVMDNGDMLTGTYNRSQKIIGWSKYTTEGSFESVSSITSGAIDQVWVITNRTINGSTARYVELLDSTDGSSNLSIYTDSGLTYSVPKTVTGITQANPGVVTATGHNLSDGDLVKHFTVAGMTEVNGQTYTVANKTANTYELTDSFGNNIDTTGFGAYTSGGIAYGLVTTISGLSHLEGEVVSVKADGATHPDRTVSSGSITLAAAAYEVVVGLKYTTTIQTLNKEFNIGSGSMQGQRMRFVAPIIRVYQSQKPLVDGEFLPSRSAADQMDTAVPLFTGDLEYGNLKWNRTGQMTITATDPLPLEVQGIFGTLESNLR